DHGSVLLESSMSGGGVYVGATRGREDNTIHIVADDLEDAKAQFITTLTRDRADRGLDQARADLAAQLPQHTLAVHPRIRRYIDNRSRSIVPKPRCTGCNPWPSTMLKLKHFNSATRPRWPKHGTRPKMSSSR